MRPFPDYAESPPAFNKLLQLSPQLKSISDLTVMNTEDSSTLNDIVRSGRYAFQAYACIFIEVDRDQQKISLKVGSGKDKYVNALIELLSQRAIRSNHPETVIDFHLLLKGEFILKNRLENAGQGVIDTKRAKALGVKSLVARPIVHSGKLFYFVLYFQREIKTFSHENYLLDIFCNHIVAWLDQSKKNKRLDTFQEIVSTLSRDLPQVVDHNNFPEILQKAKELMEADRCVIWQHIPQKRQFVMVSGLENSPSFVLDGEDYLKLRKFCSINKSNLFQADQEMPEILPTIKRPLQNGSETVLTTPLTTGHHYLGCLEARWLQPKDVKPLDQHLFQSFANHAAQMLFQTQYRHSSQQIINVMQEFTEAEDISSLFVLLLKRIGNLVNFDFGCVSRFNLRTNKLDVVEHVGSDDFSRKELSLGEGITGLCLKEMKPQKANNVREKKWKDVYKAFLPNTKSELAIPIVLTKARVQRGKKIEFKPKQLGVINLESFHLNQFSEIDMDLLQILARHAAVRYERLESLEQLKKMSELGKALLGKRDWDQIFEAVVACLKRTFGFNYVNISLVDVNTQTIATKYVFGLSEQDEKEFRRLSRHPLSSDDVQADIVRKREAEVILDDDPRLDRHIYKRFNHKDLTRVIVPMVLPSEDRVIGTVEAGYFKSSSPYIYQRDVQTLQTFIDYSVLALEQGKRGLLEVIGHEIANAVAGIRNNTDFLKRRFPDLKEGLIHRKFDDVLLDSYLLIRQVKKISYMLGAPQPPTMIKETYLFRDVVIKTIKQMMNFISEQGHNPQNVSYRNDDMFMIPPLFLDPIKLNEVVFNLVVNSIKYANAGKKGFRLEIEAAVDEDHFILNFIDWGMGIKPQYQDRIFESGFRTPEAQLKNVTGSGLGLAISRHIMMEIGGDLILKSGDNPTVFQMLLPKSLKEAPVDSLR